MASLKLCRVVWVCLIPGNPVQKGNKPPATICRGPNFEKQLYFITLAVKLKLSCGFPPLKRQIDVERQKLGKGQEKPDVYSGCMLCGEPLVLFRVLGAQSTWQDM